jgi:hypothetical protein
MCSVFTFRRRFILEAEGTVPRFDAFDAYAACFKQVSKPGRGEPRRIV